VRHRLCSRRAPADEPLARHQPGAVLPPTVQAVLLQHGVPRVLPVYDTLAQAVAHSRSRPPFLSERFRLVSTLDAIGAARWFVGEVCQRWQLDELTATAQALVGEITSDAVLDGPIGVDFIELRMELRASGLLLAVQSRASSLAVTPADHEGEPGSGLEVVQRVAERWGVRRQADGSWVVWCILGVRGPNAPGRRMRLRMGGCLLLGESERPYSWAAMLGRRGSLSWAFDGRRCPLLTGRL
jgi:hypothetical protein